jgi:anti-anti-sigma regulatory factor
MQSTTLVYTLPERFAFDEDTSLKVFLREHKTSPVEINAMNLRKVDSLLLQYLIAAARVWQSNGLGFEITHLPQSLGDDLNLLGIDTHTLSWKVAA